MSRKKERKIDGTMGNEKDWNFMYGIQLKLTAGYFARTIPLAFWAA